MSFYSRICIGLFGIFAGIVILFAMDMTLNSGRFVAHAIHNDHPGCSGTCHGPHPEISASRLALPPMRDSDRPDSAKTQPRRGALLGVRVEVTGRP
jgi:hypothetical protein